MSDKLDSEQKNSKIKELYEINKLNLKNLVAPEVIKVRWCIDDFIKRNKG